MADQRMNKPCGCPGDLPVGVHGDDACTLGIKQRKVRRITIEVTDNIPVWRIMLHFDKGRCRRWGGDFESHFVACANAAQIPVNHNWFPTLEGGGTRAK